MTPLRVHLALSSPILEDNWTGDSLCGPPMMIKACTQGLSTPGVLPSQIAHDEF